MAEFKLKSFDEMFMKTDNAEENQEERMRDKEIVIEEKVVHKTPLIKINRLMKFRENLDSIGEQKNKSFSSKPFKEYERDKLQELADSIKEHGILVPILVRPIEDKDFDYQIVAGRNRVNASKLIGLEEEQQI